jgi:hypothetical protein
LDKFSRDKGILIVVQKPRTLILTVVVTIVLILLASVMPAQSVGPTGLWRLINPTEYTPNPGSNMHGIFLTSGGTSGKGSGSGWAVSDKGFIYNWDGFSWNQAPAPGAAANCQLDSVNFGGPLNPLTSVTSSSGWISGGAVGGGASAPCTTNKLAVALFYNGIGWSTVPVPSTTFPGATAEMLSVFQVKAAQNPGDTVDAWGVGEENAGAAGAIWHFSGVPGVDSWSEFTTEAVPVNSLYMTHCVGGTCGAADDGIAVGNGGTIYRWNGGTWNPRASPVATDLFGVAMSSQTSGWAVGANCKIIRTTDGNTWAGPLSAASCTAQTLRSIVLLSSSEGWAVGDADGLGATILHGTSLDSAPQWTRIDVSQIATLLGLNSVTFATSGGNLWAVGAFGVAAFCQSNCSSRSDSIWSTTTSPSSPELRSVFMDSDSDGWAVGVRDSTGNPTILHWDGGTFSWTRPKSVTPLVNPTDLNGVYLSGGSNGWAVGTAAGGPSALYWDGNTWSGKPVGPCACTMTSVFMISGSEAWATGANIGGPSNGFVMHSTTQGGIFSGPAPLVPTKALFSVFFTDGQNGWAVGGDGVGPPVIVHTISDGGDSWPAQGNPGAATVVLHSVFFQDSTHGWAAGTGSTIMYWNGIWNLVPILNLPANPVNIFAIQVTGGPPATDGWAVGVETVTGNPVTIHYDGSSWTVTPLSPPINSPGALLGMSLRSSTNGLAVGQPPNGVPPDLSYILHLDPPGGVTASTTAPSVTTTTTAGFTASATTSTSTVVTTSIATASASSTNSPTTEASTSTTEASASTTAVEVSTSTTAAPQTSTTSNTTPLALPPIPGFPLESIMAGLMIGMTALALIRRRRR